MVLMFDGVTTITKMVEFSSKLKLKTSIVLRYLPCSHLNIIMRKVVQVYEMKHGKEFENIFGDKKLEHPVNFSELLNPAYVLVEIRFEDDKKLVK
ncbi:hypothetical protein EVAR_68291_1 [Eumeta japonica]|uniref:Uncharacterized protein n=1 Tax=Eumeta variegata TaxID=151549 RepID=A0A4C2A0G1_EUMVA|nr:hypothetical protein EVAR_68291_1 [Eumeta japonica]